MKKKSIFKISIIYFVAICLLATVFTLGYLGLIENEFLSAFLIQIVVMFGIPLLMYTLISSKNIKKTFTDTGFKKINTSMILITILLGFVLYFLNGFIADLFAAIISLFGYEKITSPTIVPLNYEFLLKELLLTCILPAICEEFLHRGIVLFAGKKVKSPRFCLILSSILFGLVHLNINQFFYAAILGFLIGYVGLVSGSIFPCMIIHFMNNFLGTFIYYGAKLNWPIASIIQNITNYIYSNAITLLVVMFTSIPLLLLVYKLLVDRLKHERAKENMRTIINDLGMCNITLAEAQAKIDIINQILKQSNELKLCENKPKEKLKFNEKIFIISSIVLGTLITISSFIWGII